MYFTHCCTVVVCCVACAYGWMECTVGKRRVFLVVIVAVAAAVIVVVVILVLQKFLKRFDAWTRKTRNAFYLVFYFFFVKIVMAFSVLSVCASVCIFGEDERHKNNLDAECWYSYLALVVVNWRKRVNWQTLLKVMKHLKEIIFVPNKWCFATLYQIWSSIQTEHTDTPV